MLSKSTWILVCAFLICGCQGSVESTGTSDSPGDVGGTEDGSTSVERPVREFRRPTDVLVAGRHKVDIMELLPPPEVLELTQRLQQAVAADPEWWIEHSQKGQDGGPPPYDERMGLSEEEYKQFLVARDTLKMKKMGEGRIDIDFMDNGILNLDGGFKLQEMSRIEIDLAKDLVRTPYGDLSNPKQIDGNEDSPFGEWKGIEWSLLRPDPGGKSGTDAKFAVGKLATGRCVMYYDVTQKSPEGRIDRVLRVLYYDLPK